MSVEESPDSSLGSLGDSQQGLHSLHRQNGFHCLTGFTSNTTYTACTGWQYGLHCLLPYVAAPMHCVWHTQP
jgi:hypothetical protein